MMKICPNCGMQLTGQEKFCTGCGTACEFSAVPEQPVVEGTKQKVKRQGGKKKIVPILIAVLVVAVIVAVGVLVLKWYTSPVQKTLRALEEGDLDAVLQIVDEDKSVKTDEAVVECLQKELEEIKTGFADGTVEYANARLDLETIAKMKIRSLENDLLAVQAFVEDLNTSRTNFATAESFYASGKYLEAMEYYQLVIEDDSNYQTARNQLTASMDAYRNQALEEAAEFAAEALYDNAIAILEEALKALPGDSKLTEQIALYESDSAEKEKADALEKAAAYAGDEDYLNAWKTLKDMAAAVDADAKLVAACEDYLEQYVNQVIAAVDAKLEEGDLNAALSLINKAVVEIPTNETLSAKQEEVKAKMPVLLNTLSELNGAGWKWYNYNPVDPFGNDFSDAANYAVFDHCLDYNMKTSSNKSGYKYAYMEYRVYGKYNTLSMNLAPYYTIDKSCDAFVQVYLDDQLTYTSPLVTQKTDMFSCDVDISGAEYISVCVYVQYSSYYNKGGAIILSDVQLWP